MKEIIYLLSAILGLALGGWQDGVDIKSVLKQHEVDKLLSFSGVADEDLRLLSLSSKSVFIGGKDGFHNLTLNKDNVINHSTANWTVSKELQETCQFKGQSESKCHNFIRVFHGPVGVNNNKKSNTSSLASKRQYLMCGTNAFRPTCRWYSADLRSHGKEFSGVGYSPFDPTHPSTSVLHQDSVYAATVADFGGTDSLIYKQPLRTEQYSDLHLNSPSFVSSRSYGDLALFFFRESAIEHSNCGKRVYSRVGRICGNDNGGRKQKDRFTTFLKARLNCSIPGEFPFYFDHIQDTTEIFENKERNNEKMFYAVFTTGPNSIGASAVCSFYMKDILKAFDGPFKGQTSLQSNWLPVPSNEVPKPRPGQCSKVPAEQPDSNSAAFLKRHPLMDEAVEGTVVLTFTSNTDKFVTLTVDHSLEVTPHHIIYIGTDSGKVYKGVVNANGSSTHVSTLNSLTSPNKNVISQAWEVFKDQNESIKSLQLLGPKRLLVLTKANMTVIGVENCDRFSSCDKCISIRDPHCGWENVSQKCVAKFSQISHKERDETFLQDLEGGDTNLCPVENTNSNEIAEADQLKSIIAEDIKEDECCACTTSTTSTTTNTISNIQSQLTNTKPDLNNASELATEKTLLQSGNYSNLENEIPRLGSNYQRQDFEPYYVKSQDGLVSSKSVILATTSSAILSLFVGFSLGFLMCKWVASRQNKKNQLSSNAQLHLSANESQRLTKPIDFLVNVPTVNINQMKNDINNSISTEKTAKKIYL